LILRFTTRVYVSHSGYRIIRGGVAFTSLEIILFVSLLTAHLVALMFYSRANRRRPSQTDSQ
jgi:hypothetical protein